MAKVIAPFLIKGTIDDLNFVVTADGQNYVRIKNSPGLTPEEFKNNSKYDHIRNHGIEFGQCAKKSTIFRQLAVQFNRLAKDGSFAGRANKILLEILQEDETKPQGKRSFITALKNNVNIEEIFLNFESNKLRPLSNILKAVFQWSANNNQFTIANFNPLEDLDWPQEATHVHLAIATSIWDYSNDQFQTTYSDETILDKLAPVTTLELSTSIKHTDHLLLTFLFIGFAKEERRKYKMLHRKFNTATIIYVRKLSNKNSK